MGTVMGMAGGEGVLFQKWTDCNDILQRLGVIEG
jgi:hypothetical protein